MPSPTGSHFNGRPCAGSAASPSPTSAAGLLQALFAAGLFCAAGFFNADGLSMPSKTSAPMQPLLALPRLDPAEELISSTKEEGDSSTSPESWMMIGERFLEGGDLTVNLLLMPCTGPALPSTGSALPCAGWPYTARMRERAAGVVLTPLLRFFHFLKVHFLTSIAICNHSGFTGLQPFAGSLENLLHLLLLKVSLKKNCQEAMVPYAGLLRICTPILGIPGVRKSIYQGHKLLIIAFVRLYRQACSHGTLDQSLCTVCFAIVIPVVIRCKSVHATIQRRASLNNKEELLQC